MSFDSIADLIADKLKRRFDGGGGGRSSGGGGGHNNPSGILTLPGIVTHLDDSFGVINDSIVFTQEALIGGTVPGLREQVVAQIEQNSAYQKGGWASSYNFKAVAVQVMNRGGGGTGFPQMPSRYEWDGRGPGGGGGGGGLNQFSRGRERSRSPIQPLGNYGGGGFMSDRGYMQMLDSLWDSLVDPNLPEGQREERVRRLEELMSSVRKGMRYGGGDSRGGVGRMKSDEGYLPRGPMDLGPGPRNWGGSVGGPGPGPGPIGNGNSDDRRRSGRDRCHKCNRYGHYARDCKGEERCFICDKPGHLSSDCDQPRGLCYKCGDPTHFARDCQQQSANNTGPCYRCGEGGHYARDCTQPANNEGVQCYRCGLTGHFAADCEKYECYNCGEGGHTFKQCDKQSKCFNCQEFGHMSRDCTAPKAKQQ